MRFEFIDNNSLVDAAARQRVRKHAATGKNIGRKLSRPSKKRPGCAKPAVQSKVVMDNPLLHQRLGNFDKPVDPDEDGGQSRFNKIERQIGDGLKLIIFPTNETLTPRSKGNIRRSMYQNKPQQAPK
jgi:hypothetical protein